MDEFYTGMAKAAEALDLAESGEGPPLSDFRFAPEGAAPDDGETSVLYELFKMRQKAPMYPPTRESAEELGPGVWNYGSKVKFYMRVPDEPKGDATLSLTASPCRVDGALLAQETEVFVNNRSIGKWLWEEPGEKTLDIPKEILEESFGGEMRLLTLTFIVTLPGEPDSGLGHSLNFEKIEFRPR
jgi:hypothetical protein